jgi:formylglycine-generating enzyme required for sulfatase activity
VATVPSAAERAAWVGKSLHYLLPSADEWHKAAYYKGGSTDAGYWSYPLKSNAKPISGPPGASQRANVTDLGGNFAVPGPIHLTDVGAYLSTSPYGMSDMAGNVYQYTDGFDPSDPQFIRSRGGSFSGSAEGTAYFAGAGSVPSGATNEIGFRIAMVPEPGTLTLAAVLAGFALFAARRMRRSRAA